MAKQKRACLTIKRFRVYLLTVDPAVKYGDGVIFILGTRVRRISLTPQPGSLSSCFILEYICICIHSLN